MYFAASLNPYLQLIILSVSADECFTFDDKSEDGDDEIVIG